MSKTKNKNVHIRQLKKKTKKKLGAVPPGQITLIFSFRFQAKDTLTILTKPYPF